MSSIKKSIDALKNFFNKAKGEALKITIIYLMFGCFWILLSDLIAELIFVERSIILLASILKGIFYVFITSALIYALTYPSLKKVMDTKEKLKIINQELIESNKLFKGLYIEYDKKQAVLKSLINSIPDLIFYKDINSLYLGCNKAFEDFVGKPESEVIGSSDFNLFDKEMAEFFIRMDKEMLRISQSRRNEEWVKYPCGRKAILETLKTPFYDSEGNIIGLIGISRDISERKIREEEILYLSHHDLLTGLYNRTYLQEEKKRVNVKLPLSVIMGDINGLKLINDSFGHAQGDKHIIEISKILKACCRSEDIIARTGGDEFTILLPGTDGKIVKSIVDEIYKVCEERLNQIDNQNHFTNIALGYATKNEIDESLEKIIQAAEDFMYRQKLFEYKSLHSSFLTSIKRTMFEKSNETEEHAERMAQLSKKLGQTLELSAQQLVELELLSTLHDIGKISVDKNILTKTENLTQEDWHEIKKHPEVGYRIAKSSPELTHIAGFILSHHERWDGQGYPQGLVGEEIPLLSRIIAIVDAYDAMTQDRSYRKAITKQKALEEILKNAGTQFDPEIAKIFANSMIN